MRKREILIVEDDSKFRNSIKLALKGEEYTFYEAETVKEAISKLSENLNIKVILLDLSLPDGTGADFLEKTRGQASKYRVIILTAHEEHLAAEKARDFSVFNYLPKTATAFTQSIRFIVAQAFIDIERELLKDKNNALIEIQKKINSDIQENANAEKTLEALKNALNLICQSVRNLVGAYTCHIRLYNLKTGDFDLAAFDGPHDEIVSLLNSPRRKGVPFSGIIASKKTPLLFEDLQNDEEFKAIKAQLLKRMDLLENDLLLKTATEYLDTTRSAFIAPITTRMFDNEVDAILNVGSDSVGFFSEEKQEVIKEFVTQATIAITKVWQKKRREESQQDYKGISKVLEDISKELRGGDIKHQIFNVAIKGISEIIRPEIINIYLFNRTTGLLDNEAQFRGNRLVTPSQTGHHPNQGLTGWVFTNGNQLRIPNFQHRDRRKPQEHHNYSRDLEIDNVEDIPSGRVDHYLGVPMVIGDEVIGAIQLLNKKSEYYLDPQISKERWLLERGFSDDEETVLGIAASHLAVVIKNAELIENLDRKFSQLDTLKDVGRYTSSEMPLDDLLETIIEQAANVMRAEICMLFLKDESGEKIILEQCYGIDLSVIHDAYYKTGEDLVGEVGRTGAPILQKAHTIIEKYDTEILACLRQEHGGEKNIESSMIVPIETKGKIIGVIKAINKRDDNFQYNEEDLSFFEAFARNVGVAIENARIYELTNEKLIKAREGALLSLMVRAVAHEINNTQGLIPANIQAIRHALSHSNYEVNEMLDVIEDSAKQCVDFVREISGFSASRMRELRVEDVNKLVDEYIRTQLLPNLEKYRNHENISLEINLSTESLTCRLYETPFIQVVRNIIINAYQAMEKKEQGILTITSAKDRFTNTAIIEFADTGCGIEEANLTRIFEPEFTTKENGNGIGLWLVKTHLHQIGGNIKVRSKLNEGTKFSIEIPLAIR